MVEKQKNNAPTNYEIKIKGHVDTKWAEWFYDMTITHESDGTTTLRGPLPDQTVLHSVLGRIRDMNMKLISVNKIKESHQIKRKEMSNKISTQSNDQYSLAKILGIWVAAALPMALLGWVAHPALAVKSDPLGSGVIRVILMTVGLMWQFVLSMIIVYREEGNLRWATIRRRFWLNKPRDPKTGEPRGWLWLWLIPIIILLAGSEFTISQVLNGAWIKIFPFFAEPLSFAMGPILESPDVQAQLVGAWWFLVLFLIMAVFNTFLGEEFIFRGVLLPKMEGVFGKWDWVANGVLMGAYHWHQPWGIPGNIFVAVLFFAFPAKRFRSNWLPIIAHSMQYLLVIPMILALVLGLM